METIRSFFFKPTPQELHRKWSTQLRAEQRALDKQLNSISLAESKTKRLLKQTAKTRPNDVVSQKTLAREIVRARKESERVSRSRALVGSVLMQLNEQMATYKISNSLRSSTKIMKDVNTLVSLPQISAQMREMSMEMTKAGIIDEMIGDTLDELGVDEELDEEADEEVDKILEEVVGGKLANAAKVPEGRIAEPEPVQEEEDEEDVLAGMRQRLEALKG
ncbi:Vacuolar protein-sorting-associated protein 24 [Saitoella coloradoensis]